jgi:protein TonB
MFPRIAISNLAPKSLPSISVDAGPIPSDVVFGSGSASTGGPLGILAGGGGGDSAAPWTGRELLMRIVRTSAPRYPEPLRQAGVDGRVLIRFVVDTMGRIEPSSVQVLASTHALFTRAVLDALGGFSFRPAEAGGRRVEAAAEMPFEFSISRTR